MQQCETVIHARAGLLGNPSDGYFGKTIACLVENFSARVTLTESPRLQLSPHPRFDPHAFDDLAQLAAVYTAQGYYGGMRLLQAACMRFYRACQQRGLVLDAPNFTLSYATDIPQQVGLSGSSAIVTATLRALLHWYDVEAHFTPEMLPAIALAVEEEELGITGGLQDRVVQSYGGLVYMDFARPLLETRGYGDYQRLDPRLLPPLFLAYVRRPSDSGKFHSDVRRRWLNGEPEVRRAMETFAGFAETGKTALEAGDYATISALMHEAFQLRRKIFGDAVLGPANLRMVALANQSGLTATTCGSGGAIVGCLGDEAQTTGFAEALAAEGYQFLHLRVGAAYPWSAAAHGQA